ncbi:MAG: DUF4279 domain-containing protein [Dehalococcoidia bacterium]
MMIRISRPQIRVNLAINRRPSIVLKDTAEEGAQLPMSTVDESVVSFRLFGDDLEPDLVTAKLALTPSSANAKGTPFGGRSRGHYQTGVWLLDSQLPKEAELNDHLQWLLDRLEPRIEEITEMRNMGYGTDFYCSLFMFREQAGIELTPEILSGIAALGAVLGLSMNCFEDDVSNSNGNDVID